jgi:hypothetical protein
MVSSTITTKFGNCAPVAQGGGVKENEQVRRDLLEYCKRDTYAMVRLLELVRAV